MKITPDNSKITYFPLTFPQKEIWYMETLFPDTSIANIACNFKFYGKYNLELIKRVLNMLIVENDALRIRFREHKGIIKQFVYPGKKDLEFDLYDLRNNNKEDIYKKDEELTAKLFNKINSDLYYFAIFIISYEEVWIYTKIHHTISDGWSLGLLGNQFIEYYSKLNNNIPILSTKKPSYIKFIQREIEYLTSDRYWEDKEFWSTKYSTFPEFIELKARNNKMINPKSNRLSFTIDKEIADKINYFTEKHGQSVFRIFMAVLYIYIYRLTQKYDIVIGTSYLNRLTQEEYEMIGMFISTIPIRLHLNDNMSFLSVLSEFKTEFKSCLLHQQYPYEHLLEDFRKKHDSKLNIIDITLSYLNAKFMRVPVGDFSYSLRWHPYKYQTESINIYVNDREDKGLYIINFDYIQDLFHETEIKRMYEHMLNILRDCLDNAEKNISDISLISREEEYRILNEFSNSNLPVSGKNTITHLFEEQVRRTPENIAIVYRDQKLSYKELNDQANRLAQFLLHKIKVKREDLIGILIESSIHQIIAILGILKAGAAYVPLDPMLPVMRMKTILDDGEITTVISSKKNIQILNKLQWECTFFSSYICLDTENVYKEEDMIENKLMDTMLWKFIAEKTTDHITGGGWLNSYTGEPFSIKEMNEYGDNAVIKLQPYLNKNTRVLEIGCATGITMYRIAPFVEYYLGTDLSDIIIKKNMEYIKKEKIKNIELNVLAAHEINKITEKSFDIIIMNSVIQCFPGHNYLRKIIRECIKLANDKAMLFIGDIMDQDKKNELSESLIEYKRENRQEGIRTKVDFSRELFIAKKFLCDLKCEFPEIEDIYFSDKIFTIENELTKYRYDSIIKVNKKLGRNERYKKCKNQYGFDSIKEYSIQSPSLSVLPNNLAYVIYTSGSTGIPKGVMVEHKSIVRVVKNTNYIEITPDDVLLQLSNYSFDGSVFDIFGAILNGAKLVIVSKEELFDIHMLADLIDKKKISIFFVTTALFNALVDTNIKVFKNVKKVLFGGEKVSVDHTRRAFEYLGENRIIHVYGPTESTVFATYYYIDEPGFLLDTIPIGKPVSGTAVFILGKDHQLQPIGIAGELCISGEGLARGYVKNHDLTEAKFIHNPFNPGERLYKTGDIAKWFPDGNIGYIGRIDNQVKIRGFRIELEEIEHYLSEHEQIKEVIVLPYTQGSDKYLCAYVVAEDGVTGDELRKYLLEKVPDYMVPSYFMYLKKMPLTVNGKIDKKALPKPDVSEPYSENYLSPKSKIEKIFIKVLQEILALERISLNDNYFLLGGDSIKAIQLTSKLKSYNLNLNVQKIFEYPVLKELCPYITEIGVHSDQNVIKGTVRLTPIQKWFCERDIAHQGQFNMYLTIFSCQGFKASHVKKIFKELVIHHDALRMIFKITNSKIIQINRGIDSELFDLKEYDLKCKSDYLKIMKKISEKIKLSIDLAKGPLVKLGLFHTVKGSYLLIVIHHLIFDLVSWIILLQDFYTIYKSILEKKEIKLPLKTTSFRYWSDALYKYANSDNLFKEFEYWSSLNNISYAKLPQDIYLKTEIQKYSKILVVELSKRDTDMLIKNVNNAYHTDVEDILVAALILALAEWTQNKSILIAMESHGRENIIDNIDTTRTVGWFTSIYPLLVQIESRSTLSKIIRTVKETIRRVPHKGIGYGILKYVTIKDKLKGISFDLNPELSFNYLGHLDKSINSDLFVVNEIPSYLAVHPDLKRFFKFEVTALILNDILTLSICYNEKEYFEKTVRNILDVYKSSLQKIITHCLLKKNSELTVSDLSSSDISQDEVEAVYNILENS